MTPGSPTSQTDEIEEIRQVVQDVVEAAMNADSVALADLISSDCAQRDDVLFDAALSSALMPTDFDVEVPLTAMQVEFMGGSSVVVSVAEGGKVKVSLRGEPVQLSAPREEPEPLQLIRELDGEWRLLNCETIKYEA
jgi:hypothetical protein